ncbi:glycosyltransferase family protein [Mucilaginibacter segetis]|uniref:Glycosyltransferase involved in cell wall biosynthesis n=1 Tax=Mucilaginibacter segetis TaxID=2793071 RepID=A0A934PTQ2_9SPHI|nr:hypothetical protein [Mucilaginibacter segetis]MBK0380659.1 hypothetical protein [Mucilaginibacter segetis]
MTSNFLNIIFICSSLEEGADGVGDYTRRLSAALISKGHQCAIAAVNDIYINEIVEGSSETGNIQIPVIRIPSVYDKQKRLAIAKDFVNKIDPQWLSLQYVPFGYHPKGLKLGLSRFMFSLSKGRKWHIMFHELWVGMAMEESNKLVLWGKLQRQFIRKLIKITHPQVIHTQTRLYQRHLQRMGFNADYLPLFSNIPVTTRSFESERKEIALVIFGSIHDKAPIELFAAEASRYAQAHNTPVSLTIIGRGNAEQERWANVWKMNGMPVDVLGEQSPERISEILANSTYGISATALAVIEKSGSVAAMREHGLTVISVAKPWHPHKMMPIAIPEGVVEYRTGNFEECINFNRSVPHINSVINVSVKFADALIGYNPANN